MRIVFAICFASQSIIIAASSTISLVCNNFCIFYFKYILPLRKSKANDYLERIIVFTAIGIHVLNTKQIILEFIPKETKNCLSSQLDRKYLYIMFR